MLESSIREIVSSFKVFKISLFFWLEFWPRNRTSVNQIFDDADCFGPSAISQKWLSHLQFKKLNRFLEFQRVRNTSRTDKHTKQLAVLQCKIHTFELKFIFLEWICKIRARASSVGFGNSIFLSNRPDRSKAGSKMSTRLVAAIT